MDVREWTEDLSVGFTELDRQHMYLFAQLNELTNLTDDMPHGVQALNRMGDALFDHFAAEERYMAAMSYPGLNSHRMEHRMFARVFSKVMMRVHSHPSASSVRTAHETLGNWMVKHILETDVHLGRFLAEHLEKQPAAW